MRHRDSRPYRRSDWRSFILPGVLGVGVTVGIGALALNDPPRLLHVPQPAERPIHASKAAERRHEIPPPFPSPAEVEQRPRKQVVFTDANYTPKPAANVVRGERTLGIDPPPRKKEVGVIAGIKEAPRVSDACWPYKPGSIERRNCKMAVELSRR